MVSDNQKAEPSETRDIPPAAAVTIAIPTYGREAVLVDTIRHVLALQPRPAEILIVDQTPRHEAAVEDVLREWEDSGAIVLVRLSLPSIPRAMNEALLRARNPIVLFLDDDLVPCGDLVAQHRDALASHGADAVVGQIIQPGESVRHGSGSRAADRVQDLSFAFNGDQGRDVTNVMAGNLSVRRDKALAIGGFDENFTTTAYRFETDFAWRLVDAGGRIRFEPGARIDHLQAARGGLRTWGSHLTSGSPAHSTGDYYFAKMNLDPSARLRYVLGRFRKTVLSRFDLSHPWWIPVKLVRELRAMLHAVRLSRRGRALLPRC